MQPENQPGAPVPPTPQAPQPTPQPQPGQPVPQGQPLYQSPAQQPVQPQQQPQPVPTPVPQAASPAPSALGNIAVAAQVDGGYGYQDDETQPYEPEEIDLSRPVSWRAQEYIHQEKGTKWFLLFGVVFIALMAIAVLTGSWSFAVLLVVIAAVIIILAKRPPREIEYSLSEEGLHVDNTLHKYADFKSFGVIRDGEEFSIMLIPRRRFQPGITVYFPEEAGEDIVDVLGSRLPMRDLHLDAVDKLVRKLRL